jgi:hypothetical protein
MLLVAQLLLTTGHPKAAQVLMTSPFPSSTSAHPSALTSSAAGDHIELQLLAAAQNSSDCFTLTQTSIAFCELLECRVVAHDTVGLLLFKYGIIADIAFLPDVNRIDVYVPRPEVSAPIVETGFEWTVTTIQPEIVIVDPSASILIISISGQASLFSRQGTAIESHQLNLRLTISSDSELTCSLVSEPLPGISPQFPTPRTP